MPVRYLISRRSGTLALLDARTTAANPRRLHSSARPDPGRRAGSPKLQAHWSHRWAPRRVCAQRCADARRPLVATRRRYWSWRPLRSRSRNVEHWTIVQPRLSRSVGHNVRSTISFSLINAGAIGRRLSAGTFVTVRRRRREKLPFSPSSLARSKCSGWLRLGGLDRFLRF